jgi:hypothetical protein
MKQNDTPVLVRVNPTVRQELDALAHEHGRSLAGEGRAALDAWLDLHRRELLAAWRTQRRAAFMSEIQEHEETADAESS